MARAQKSTLTAEEDVRRNRAFGLTSLSNRLARLVLEHPPTVVWTVALFPLLCVVLMVIGKLLTPRLYRYLIAEDTVVEYATFATFLLAALVAVRLAIDFRGQHETVFFLSYSLLAAGLFIIAMEEISWGQRIFSIETPSFLESRNYKGETNFHNLGGFPVHNAFIVVGLYGAFARLLVPGRVKRRQPMLVDLFTPPYALFLYFFLPCALYIHYEYLYYRYLVPLDLEWNEFYSGTYAAAFATGKDQEPIELLLSLGFLLFVVVNRYRYPQSRAAPPAGGARRTAPSKHEASAS
jgi:hypothetical protein